MLNNGLNYMFDLAWRPFPALPVIWGIAAWAVATGVVTILIFHALLDSERLKRTRKLIEAHFFEIRLYHYEAATVFRALWGIFRELSIFLSLQLRPLLGTIPIFVLVIIHLHCRAGYIPVAPGDAFILKAELADWPKAGLPQTELTVPPGLELEAPPVRVAAEKTVYWRLKTGAPGEYRLGLRLTGGKLERPVYVGMRPTRLAREYISRGLWHGILHPASVALDPGMGIRSISIDYPETRIWVGPLSLSWMGIFLIISILSGFVVQEVFQLRS